jgi:hypothetical protein
MEILMKLVVMYEDDLTIYRYSSAHSNEEEHSLVHV